MRAVPPIVLLLCLAGATAGLAQAPASPQPAAAPAAAARKPEPQLLGRITFFTSSAEVSPEMQARIDGIAALVPPQDSDRRRIQILGFASGDLDLISANRRLSLERAVAVRDRLVARGVAKDRIDIRALGTTRYGEETLDRVDIILGTVTLPSTKAERK